MSHPLNVSTIWYTRCPVPTPLGLAARLGWFEDAFGADGITIRTLQETVDAQLRESHYDHHLPHSFRQGGNVPAIWARARGADTRVIGLNWVDEAQVIVVLPDSGIRGVQDLAGRKIGLPRHANSIDHARAGALRGFEVGLAAGGLAWADIEAVDLPVAPSGAGPADASRTRNAYATEFAALASGLVDAVYVKGARGLQAAALHGAQAIYDLRDHPDPRVRANNGAPRPITVDGTLLRERPDLVVRFLARIVQVGDWAAAHAAETVSYIASESGSTDEWVRRAYGNDVHLHQGTDLNPESVDALESYKNFLLGAGFLDADFAVSDWIDPAPLAEVLRQSQRQAA